MGEPIHAIAMPGGMLNKSLDGKTVTTEPHHVILEVGGLGLRITDCLCEQCVNHEAKVLELQFVLPEELAAELLAIEVPYLTLSCHPDLLRPAPDGEPLQMLETLAEYVGLLVASSVQVDWVELRPGMAPGTWFKTVGYHFIRPDLVIVPGLIGQVAHDVYAACDSGVATLARIEGIDDPNSYGSGYLSELLEALPQEPTHEEKEAARALQARAFDVYEAEQGWTGFLVLGKGRPRSQVEARRELGTLAAWLEEHRDEARWPDIKGRWKRMRKILTAFSERGGMSNARLLVEKMSPTPGPDDLSAEGLAEIVAFAERPIPTDGFPKIDEGW